MNLHVNSPIPTRDNPLIYGHKARNNLSMISDTNCCHWAFMLHPFMWSCILQPIQNCQKKKKRFKQKPPTGSENNLEVGQRPIKFEEKGTRGKASWERKCRRHVSFGGTRDSQSISSRRSPHSQCHVIFFILPSLFLCLWLAQSLKPLRRGGGGSSLFMCLLFYLWWMVATESLILRPNIQRPSTSMLYIPFLPFLNYYYVIISY